LVSILLLTSRCERPSLALPQPPDRWSAGLINYDVLHERGLPTMPHPRAIIPRIAPPGLHGVHPTLLSRYHPSRRHPPHRFLRPALVLPRLRLVWPRHRRLRRRRSPRQSDPALVVGDARSPRPVRLPA